MVVAYGLAVVVLVLGAGGILLAAKAARGRLGIALAAAFSLLVVGALTYLTALGLAFDEPCGGRPGLRASGLDKPISWWPPGAECPPYGPEERREVKEPVPALRWVSLSLVIAAPVVALIGVIASIRDLRRREDGSRAATASRGDLEGL